MFSTINNPEKNRSNFTKHFHFYLDFKYAYDTPNSVQTNFIGSISILLTYALASIFNIKWHSNKKESLSNNEITAINFSRNSFTYANLVYLQKQKKKNILNFGCAVCLTRQSSNRTEWTLRMSKK